MIVDSEDVTFVNCRQQGLSRSPSILDSCVNPHMFHMRGAKRPTTALPSASEDVEPSNAGLAGEQFECVRGRMRSAVC